MNELRKYLTENAGARSYIHAPAFSTRYFLNLFCSSDYEYYLNLSLKHRAYKLYLLNMIATISGSIPGAGNLKKLFNWMKIHGLPQNHNKDARVR